MLERGGGRASDTLPVGWLQKTPHHNASGMYLKDSEAEVHFGQTGLVSSSTVSTLLSNMESEHCGSHTIERFPRSHND